MANLTKLIRYSEEKLDKLKSIEEYTRQQKTAIDNHRLADLVPLVDKKQRAIDYIDRCDNAFQDELDRIKREYGVKTLVEIEKIKGNDGAKTLVGTISKIVETIKRIQILEEENNKRLDRAMEQVKGKLKKVRQGKKSVALYESGPDPAAGSFIDKKK